MVLFDNVRHEDSLEITVSKAVEIFEKKTNPSENAKLLCSIPVIQRYATNGDVLTL